MQVPPRSSYAEHTRVPPRTARRFWPWSSALSAPGGVHMADDAVDVVLAGSREDVQSQGVAMSLQSKKRGVPRGAGPWPCRTRPGRLVVHLRRFRAEGLRLGPDDFHDHSVHLSPPPGTLPSWGKRTLDFERLRMSIRLFARWQAEMERSAAIGIRPRPEPTVMGLDDRAADRQSHAHALRLGRIKRLEETLEAL